MSTFINDDQAAADAATYEDEVTSRRTVTIPLREYDKLKEEQQFIKDCEDIRKDIEEFSDLLKDAGFVVRWDKILKPLYDGKTIH